MTGCSRRSTAGGAGCRKHRYLVGSQITEAMAAVPHFGSVFDVAISRCSSATAAHSRLSEPPELHARAFYQVPGVAATVTRATTSSTTIRILKVNPT